MQEAISKRSSFGLTKLIIGILISLLILFGYFKDPLQRFELITFDYRTKVLTHRDTHPDIVLIEMAEDSIDAIGRWPWPREWHATLITALAAQEPKAIVFDALFSEKGAELGDASLEEAIKKAGSVYLPFVFEFSPRTDLEVVRNIIFPLDRFSMWTKGAGHINIFPDIDGTIRRAPLVINFKSGEFPHLAFQVAADYLGLSKEDIELEQGRYIKFKGIRADPRLIPLDKDNNMIIRWAGPWKDTFKHYSYIDIITSYENTLAGEKPSINLEEFRGKICLVGLTATGLHDVRSNPIEPLYPALGVNAYIINNILNNDFIRVAPRLVNVIIILILGIAMNLAISRLRPIRGIVVTFLILVGYLVLSFALFKFLGLWINVVYPVVLIIASYSVVTLYSQITVAVERSRLFTLATRDSVTGLYVLRHFYLLLEAEMGLTQRHTGRRRLSILMGDLDFFKKINDSYGHQGGNVILRDIARIIRSNLRELDIPCRFGGEEFVIMLPGTSLEEARIVAERIRKGVELHHFRYGDKVLRITISFGVADLGREKTKDQLIKKADDALYKAKRGGRNKVCVAEG